MLNLRPNVMIVPHKSVIAVAPQRLTTRRFFPSAAPHFYP